MESWNLYTTITQGTVQYSVQVYVHYNTRYCTGLCTLYNTKYCTGICTLYNTKYCTGICTLYTIQHKVLYRSLYTVQHKVLYRSLYTLRHKVLFRSMNAVQCTTPGTIKVYVSCTVYNTRYYTGLGTAETSNSCCEILFTTTASSTAKTEWIATAFISTGIFLLNTMDYMFLTL